MIYKITHQQDHYTVQFVGSIMQMKRLASFVTLHYADLNPLHVGANCYALSPDKDKLIKMINDLPKSVATIKHDVTYVYWIETVQPAVEREVFQDCDKQEAKKYLLDKLTHLKAKCGPNCRIVSKHITNNFNRVYEISGNGHEYTITCRRRTNSYMQNVHHKLEYKNVFN